VFPELSATERDEVVAALQRHLGGG
jgi:hypothetical protein